MGGGGGVLSSLSPSIIVYSEFNVHVDTECIDQKRFLNLLDTSNLVQSINKPTHLHCHMLDLIFQPNDSNFVGNVTVCDLVSDHVLVKCHLDLTCPAIPKVDSTASIIILEIPPLSCILLALSLTHMISINMTLVVVRQTCTIECGQIKKNSVSLLSDSYCRAKSIRPKFEHMKQRQVEQNYFA